MSKNTCEHINQRFMFWKKGVEYKYCLCFRCYSILVIEKTGKGGDDTTREYYDDDDTIDFEDTPAEEVIDYIEVNEPMEDVLKQMKDK